MKWLDRDRLTPKPHDILPGESYERNQIKIKNNSTHTIAIGQMASDWDTVNFVIEDYERYDKNIRWMATLTPETNILITFNKLKEITP